jgi:hypothetical protein
MVQRSTTLQQHRLGRPTPVQMPVHDCDHEYGCICRGATIVHAIAVADWQPQAIDLLSLDVFCVPVGIVEIDGVSAQPDDDQNPPPPLSGRQLRALYASLVI